MRGLVLWISIMDIVKQGFGVGMHPPLNPGHFSGRYSPTYRPPERMRCMSATAVCKKRKKRIINKYRLFNFANDKNMISNQYCFVTVDTDSWINENAIESSFLTTLISYSVPKEALFAVFHILWTFVLSSTTHVSRSQSDTGSLRMVEIKLNTSGFISLFFF